MKLTVFLVACMALVAVQAASVQNDLKVGAVDMSFLEMQKFITDVVINVYNEPQDEEILKLAKPGLAFDKGHYKMYDEYMEKFEHSYKLGELLPRTEFYSALQRTHLYQQLGLFRFFMYAKDWATLVSNIAWARIYVNPAMFVSALTLTVIHREDMQGIILPPIYEILPELFFPSKYIMAAKSFDWEVFNKQIMLEKEFPEIYKKLDTKYPDDIVGNRFHDKEWKTWQWWKLMGLDDGWQDGKVLLTEFHEVMKNNPNMASIYENKKLAWLPIDYTRDIGIFNDDSELSYFTEDVGWNAYWYYLNMDYSKGLIGKDFGLDKDRRGEWWIYNVQQMLARYYMERLSNGLGEIPELDWYGVYKTGYDPQLVAYNGNGFTFRKNYWEIESLLMPGMKKKIMLVESRILNAIDSGKYKTADGTIVDFFDPKSIEYVGNMLHGNIDIIDKNYFGYFWYYASSFLSGEGYLDYLTVPNVLMNYETMMRDPMFYSMLKGLVKIYYAAKKNYEPYTKKELLLPGVKIVDVEVSELKTFFDLEDVDFTTLLGDKQVYHDGKLVWDNILLGRQLRLNHKPFEFDIHVQSDKIQKVVVRVFLGPEFNQYGQKLSMVENRENYMELDEFVYDLVVGKNEIKRKSVDFEWVGIDPMTFSELYNYVEGAVEGKYKFEKNISAPHDEFPARLILPHGWVKGMPMGMFFVISPYNAEYQQYASYDPTYLAGIGSGVRHIDNMPFGYPFDRKIEDLYKFIVPNMYYKTVKIYHMDKYQKYYPLKYEKYGSFDYEF